MSRKVVVSTNVVSPHVAPLALELGRQLYDDSVTYIYLGDPSDVHRSQEVYGKIKEIAVDARSDQELAQRLLHEADVLVENVRNFNDMEARIKTGKLTFYVSERWFKPIRVDAARNSERSKGNGIWASGFWKIILPFVLKRVKRIVRLLTTGDKFYYLANGIFAAQDMARVCGLLNGDWRCLFRAPALEYERVPGGRIWTKDLSASPAKYGLEKMRMWGYFVEPTSCAVRRNRARGQQKILWVGRMFGWKRLDTLMKAVGGVSGMELDVFGEGPEESRLRRLASNFENIRVYKSVPLSTVRELMQSHDVYVLCSNSFEGWGAVINEALEEGMKVIGTYEAGASATILPETNLFHAGDWKRLREILLNPIPDVEIGSWTAENAAKALIDMVNGG